MCFIETYTFCTYIYIAIFALIKQDMWKNYTKRALIGIFVYLH